MADEKDNVQVEELKITKRKKTSDEIEKENADLMEAFAQGKEGEGAEKKDEEQKGLDPDVLAKLKAKTKKKEEKVADLVDQKEVSINMGIVGIGQAGSRLAELFHQNGYDAGVINTSPQDLDAIDLLPNQKLLLEGSLGGTGKDRDLSAAIFEENEDQVRGFVEKVIEGNDMIGLCSSSGGGTGSGSISLLCKLVSELELPIAVIFVLPKKSEGAANKKNALEALSELSSLAAHGIIDSLMVVDNARLEVLLSHVGHGKFWSMANQMIVDPLILLNHFTATSTSDAMDPSDFGKILTGGGVTIYGVLESEDYMDETGLAEAVLETLSDNMLSEGFDLAQATVGGAIYIGSPNTIDEIPSINLDYAQHMVSEATDGADLYRGIYKDPSMPDGVVKVVSMFSGLGLPKERVDELQEEVEKLEKAALEKSSKKAQNIELELNKNRTASARASIHKKIKKKKSGFGKLQGGVRKGSLIDKRRKKK
ncbi:hypothetical protein GF361_05075 [Candidatus Woesearchaeota archaeon]|nr:hypothetical protein [Candidatus Woesearchaeota archaeon]